jgi:hypothetical protein
MVAMTNAEAFEVILRHFESLFPMTCSNCGRQYATLREYVVGTTRVGRAISYDAESGDWETTRPVGTLALANCSCGTTLGLSTRGMAPDQRLALLAWLKEETERRRISPSELLDEIRDAVRKAVLGEPAR